MPESSIELVSTELTATISLLGAELTSLRSVSGKEYIWQGEPTIWKRHAPILFPIIGQLHGGGYTHNGVQYPITQHGFARDMVFEIVHRTDSAVTLSLQSSEDSRKIYPFDFKLAVSYELHGCELVSEVTAFNLGSSPLPCALGIHPGFALENDEVFLTTVEFSEVESSLCKKVKNGLLTEAHFTTPLTAKTFSIENETFSDDAFVIPNPYSREITLTSPTRSLVITFGDSVTNIALWSKQHAPFICIEPWVGSPDSMGSPEEIAEKDALVHVPRSLNLSWSVRIL